MQADAGFLNHVHAGQPAGPLRNTVYKIFPSILTQYEKGAVLGNVLSAVPIKLHL
jgi:hypothetical protein